MWKIKETEDGKLMLHGKKFTENVNIFHCSEDIKELQDDVADIYAVAEEAGFGAEYRVHLTTAFSEQEAWEQVEMYLRNKLGDKYDGHHIISIDLCEIEE